MSTFRLRARRKRTHISFGGLILDVSGSFARSSSTLASSSGVVSNISAVVDEKHKESESLYALGPESKLYVLRVS